MALFKWEQKKLVLSQLRYYFYVKNVIFDTFNMGLSHFWHFLFPLAAQQLNSFVGLESDTQIAPIFNPI